MLHTIGSHGPTYYIAIQRRFANSRRPATPMRSRLYREQLTNTYDNTILYVDYVVDKAINYCNLNRINLPLVWFICPSCDGAVALRRLPAALRHFRALSAAAGAKENYSQDNLFSTLLGLLGVSTREYRRQMIS